MILGTTNLHDKEAVRLVTIPECPTRYQMKVPWENEAKKNKTKQKKAERHDSVFQKSYDSVGRRRG